MSYYVYVFELIQDECVKACRARSCRQKSERSRCLYVGSSAHPASSRVAERARTSRHVRRGRPVVRWDLMPSPSRFGSRVEATRAERETARRLRAEGFTVFQA